MARSARYRTTWGNCPRCALVTLVLLTAVFALSSCDLVLSSDDTGGNTEVLDPGPVSLKVLRRPENGRGTSKVKLSVTRWSWLTLGRQRKSLQMQLLGELGEKGPLGQVITTVTPCEPYTALVLGGGVLGTGLLAHFSGAVPTGEPAPVQDAYQVAGALSGAALWLFLPSCDQVSVEAQVGPRTPGVKAMLK